MLHATVEHLSFVHLLCVLPAAPVCVHVEKPKACWDVGSPLFGEIVYWCQEYIAMLFYFLFYCVAFVEGFHDVSNLSPTLKHPWAAPHAAIIHALFVGLAEDVNICVVQEVKCSCHVKSTTGLLTFTNLIWNIFAYIQCRISNSNFQPSLSLAFRMQTIRTNHTFITLRSVEPSISGKYVCEISADAPSFHTQIGELIAG